MRLGLTPWAISDSSDADTLCRQAVFAEGLGYEYFFLPEHHFTPRSAIPDPLMLLAAVAARTERIRLGTTSYLLPLRHPVQAAEQVAVLDQLSRGRVTLGVGRGYMPALFAIFGVDSKKKRMLFRDCYEQMIRAWSGESINDDPDSQSVCISPLPYQHPHPPIWVAAFGPLALKQAGTLGLPYLCSPMESKSRLTKNYALHRNACLEANRPLPAETPIMRSVFVSEDTGLVGKVRERLESEMRRSVRTDEQSEIASVDDWAIVGDRSQFNDAISFYRDELEITHLIVTRLRIGGVSSQDCQKSLEHVAELLLD